MKPLRPNEICLPRRQPGFTLVELAIVMVIVGILLVAVMMPLSIQMDLRRYADTKKTMDQINEALVGFVLINGRLPCPASKTVADGVSGAGSELLSGNVCTSYTGVIPWVTLNVPETDEWGGRFTYRVSSAFADTYANLTWGCTPSVAPASPASFALCAGGDMKVQSRTTAKLAYDMTSAVLPAVFISHGKNGYGAYGSQGTLIAAVPAANADETANASSATTFFFSREKTDASSSCGDLPGPSGPMCEFDDLIAFVPLATLMNRMVVAGKLP